MEHDEIALITVKSAYFDAKELASVSDFLSAQKYAMIAEWACRQIKDEKNKRTAEKYVDLAIEAAYQ